jgi:hypothetical protein
VSLPLTAFCLLLFRQAAGLKGAGGIDGIGAFIDVANDAVFIDHKRDAVRKQAGEVEDSVRLRDLLLGVRQQRKAGAGLSRELAIPLLGVETYAQNLRARGLKLGDITLIRLDLLRSTWRRGADVES